MHNQKSNSLGRLFLGLIACSLTFAGAVAEDSKPTPEDITFFETKIRPLLARECYRCHSAKAEKLKAGLYLDSRAGVMKGGETGPVVVPGQPDKSLLIRAVRYAEEDLEMPPDAKLSEAEVAVLEDWVRMGVPWPDDASNDALVAQKSAYDWEKFRREHWAFRPLELLPPPDVTAIEWPVNPVDFFILAGLEAAGMKPAPRADKRTLIRRAYFDLVGLPPEPEAVKAFLEDERPDAFARLVDRLLDSPHYGERWARHWLDVARYSDGMGGFLDGGALPHAWRYRDWVVDAFNRDLPYNQFVRLQVAGDLLGDYHDSLGTGFFAVGPTYISDGGDPEAKAQAQAETLGDRVDTLTRAFLGLTVACARCHDHKFDPITMRDYYALAGIFNNTKVAPRPLAPPDVIRKFNDAQNAVKEQEKQINQFLDQQAGELKINRKEVEAKLTAERKAELNTKRQHLDSLKKAVPPKAPEGHALADTGSADMHVAIRGDLRKKGEPAPRRFLEIIAGENASHFKEGSGRRQLADALVAENNPLTARVLVNRIWLHHFGQGLVRTPSNFGVLGETPTHPGLLEWLTHALIHRGWSVKDIHRTILLSATWQMNSEFNEDYFNRDGDNRLVWRMNPRRLEVEAWRDSLLAVTGELDRTVGGKPTDRILESKRRTLYSIISRNGDRYRSDAFLRLFDFPAPRTSSEQRVTSIVPQQYLFALNSPFMIDRAKALAERLQREAGEDADRIHRAYRLLYGRAPDPAELDLAVSFLAETPEENAPPKWQQYTQVLLGAHEFIQVR